METWNSGWQRTQWPGIYVCGDAVRIRARVVDPRSGRLREVNRILNHVAPEDAVEQRRLLQEELRARLHDPPKKNVVEFGRYWLGVKRAVVDAGTYARYEDALENHAFERLGRLDFRELRSIHIQDWINRELASGYRVATVKGWFRAFRTMVRDAIDCLGIAADPTRRIRFPFGEERQERNSLLPDELARFLSAMERLHPQHYALTATLALTGLRFCHASALRWEDFDEKTGILRIERRQLRGRLGPVMPTKRAPKEYPLSPELMAILKIHGKMKRRHRWRVEGWMFPNRDGGLRCPASLRKPWLECLAAAEIDERFTVHGLRRTFVDLARRAKVDGVVTRSLTGHVTEKMRLHYSTVGLDEQRTAVIGISALAFGGDGGGDSESKCAPPQDEAPTLN